MHETSKNIVTEIIAHLKENSFNTFIVWNGMNCVISNLEIFPSVVLSTLINGYTLDSFIKELQTYSIKHILKDNSLSISFPCIKQKLRRRSRSVNPILNRFEEIEIKQERLFSAILRAQEKLERAIRINKQIKIELKKSDDYQRNLIEERSKNPNIEDVIDRLIKEV